MDRVLLTPEGHAALEADLRHHREVLRPEVIQQLEEARAHGDLSENAEYDYAKDRQGMIEARMRDLEAQLSRAEVIDVTKMPACDLVIFGTTVEIFDLDSEQEFTYRIVGVNEADVKLGKISYSSPIGRALLGKELGDEVRVVTPRGTRQLEITAVRYE